MEFDIKQCGLFILRYGKVVKLGGIVLPDGQSMQDIDKIALKDQERGSERTVYQIVREEIETCIKIKVEW